jgi:hypothetical protein
MCFVKTLFFCVFAALRLCVKIFYSSLFFFLLQSSQDNDGRSMHDFKEEFRHLVTDTLAYLKQETQKEILVSPDSFAFFHEPRTPKASTLQETKASAALKPPYQPKAPSAPKPSEPTLAAKPAPEPKALPPTAPKPAAQLPSDDIRQMLQKTAPHVKLHSDPANDEAAKKLALAWKVKALAKPVVLLSFGQTGAELQFLNAIAGAINTQLQPAALVDAVALEKEQTWEIFLQSSILKQLICPPIPFVHFPECAKLYKYHPTTGEHLLGAHPLLLLSPLTDYLQTPTLKAALWKTLCQMLKSPQ